MSRPIFIDSNILVEHLRGNKRATELLESLSDELLFINDVVFSEVVYIFIRDTLKQPTEEVKRSPDLVKKVDFTPVFALLDQFELLPIDEQTIEESKELIKAHGLLPNDALILATAKLNECILATFDEVLISMAEKEGVEVIE